MKKTRPFFLLPLREKVARTKSVPDEGFDPRRQTPHRPSLRRSRRKASAFLSKNGGRRPPMHPLPQGERGKSRKGPGRNRGPIDVDEKAESLLVGALLERGAQDVAQCRARIRG